MPCVDERSRSASSQAGAHISNARVAAASTAKKSAARQDARPVPWCRLPLLRIEAGRAARWSASEMRHAGCGCQLLSHTRARAALLVVLVLRPSTSRHFTTASLAQAVSLHKLLTIQPGRTDGNSIRTTTPLCSLAMVSFTGGVPLESRTYILPAPLHRKDVAERSSVSQ